MVAGYQGGGDFIKRQDLLVWLLCQRWQDVISGRWASIQPYWVGNLWASNKELVDFQLADSPAGSHLHPSLR